MSSTLQTACEGSYEFVKKINGLFIESRTLMEGKPISVNSIMLAKFAGENGERQFRELGPPTTDDFMATYSDISRVRFGVTREEHR